jgi:hypothetical protein
MGEIIPQQPPAMVDASRSAKSFEMAKSDEELAARDRRSEETGSAITSEFARSMAWPTPAEQGDTLVLLSRGSRRNCSKSPEYGGRGDAAGDAPAMPLTRPERR